MRWLPLAPLLLLAACCMRPPRLEAAQTFIASDTQVTTTTTTEASQAFTVMSVAETYFVLGNVVVFNQSSNAVQLVLTVDEASSAFSASTITVIVPASSSFTYQVPITVSALGAGSYTARLRASANKSGALVLQTESYMGVFGSSVPGSVIVSLNGETGTVQTFATSTAGTDFAVVSAAGVHTFKLPNASPSSRGLVNNTAQTIGGLKTFADGLIPRASGVASTVQIGGASATAFGAGDIAIGDAATAGGGGSSAIAIGFGAIANGADSINIGTALGAGAAESVAVGANNTLSAADSVAIGAGVTLSAQYSVAIGRQASAGGVRTTCVGYSCNPTTATKATCIGSECSMSGNSGVAIGYLAASSNGCIAIGAVSLCTLTGSAVLGGTDKPVTTFYIGSGEATTAAANVVITTTGRSGTNLSGKNTEIRGGKGTGTGATGTVKLSVCPGGSTGTTLDTCASNLGWIVDSPTGDLLVNAGTESLGSIILPIPNAFLTNVKSISGYRWTEPFAIETLSVDGTQCSAPADHTFNSGPKVKAITCADNNAGAIYGHWHAPDSYAGGAAGALQFKFDGINENATPSGVTALDITCQCVSDGDVVGSTWGSGAGADQTWATQYAEEHWNNTVICAGSCAAGDTVYWRVLIDATNTTTTQMADVYLTGLAIEYTRGQSLAD